MDEREENDTILLTAEAMGTDFSYRKQFLELYINNCPFLEGVSKKINQDLLENGQELHGQSEKETKSDSEYSDKCLHTVREAIKVVYVWNDELNGELLENHKEYTKPKWSFQELDVEDKKNYRIIYEIMTACGSQNFNCPAIAISVIGELSRIEKNYQDNL